jgi:hypothetical protein
VAENHKTPPRAIPPSDDPAETIQRLIPRRQLKIETGDVVLARVHGGSLKRESFQLGVRGEGRMVGRFATFEHAAAAGEELATRLEARQLLVDNEGQPTYQHNDARRS